MTIKKTLIIKNDCYKAGRTIRPAGIMVHSTATPGVMAKDWFSRWNKSGVAVAVHAFVDDKEVCQHLPWNHRAWHCADQGNNTHIAFEMCEPKDWTINAEYFSNCYHNAVELTAYLCKLYGLTEKSVISHKEGHTKGIASNHGDPDHWWKHFGYTMDKFRADVKKELAGGKVVVDIDASFNRSVVRIGSKGDDVKYMQTRLNKLRRVLGLTYKDLDADGVFGEKTAKAVAEFQKARKLTADMVVGAKTWDAIAVDYGDVNGDGTVNAADALLVLKAAVGKVKLSDKQKKKADMNADGKVNAIDAGMILKGAVRK